MTLIIASSVIYFLLWAAAMAAAWRYGRIGRRLRLIEQTPTVSAETLPPLSVVVMAHNEATELRRHLPLLLEQDYERFEVIVVDMASTDDTADVLERLERIHPNLTHTRTPASARDISLPRLALTLGMRAAAAEWVVVMTAASVPATRVLLTRIGQVVTTPTRFLQSKSLQVPDMVVCTSRFAPHRDSAWLRQIGFHRLWLTLMNTLHLLAKHPAVTAESTCTVFRKSLLCPKRGFTIGQELRMGAVELLAAQNAKPTNVALLLTPSAVVEEERWPRRRQWRTWLTERVELLRHVPHTRSYTASLATQMLLPWLLLLATVALVAAPFAVPALLTPAEAAAVESYAVAMAVAAALLHTVYIVVKHTSLTLTARQMGYESPSATWLLWELLLPFWHLAARIRHRRTPRAEFRKRFVNQPTS